MSDVPEEYRVKLSDFTEQDLNGSFVKFKLDDPPAEGSGLIRVCPLGGGFFAIEIVSKGEDSYETVRFLTQSEVDSIHFGVRLSDGIKELRVGDPEMNDKNAST